MSKFKSAKKLWLLKVLYTIFEFIEHLVGFVCLASMSSTIRTARESNLLSYPQQRNWTRVPLSLGQREPALSGTKGNIQTYTVFWVLFKVFYFCERSDLRSPIFVQGPFLDPIFSWMNPFNCNLPFLDRITVISVCKMQSFQVSEFDSFETDNVKLSEE